MQSCSQHCGWLWSILQLNHSTNTANGLVLDNNWDILLLLKKNFFPAPSASPQHLHFFNVTSTSLVLSWVPPPVENRNGDIQHYTIAITETETGERFNRTVSNYTSMLLTQLHPYYRYKCQVAAVTVEIGPFGVPIVIQTLQDGKIAHPQTSCIHPACTTNAFDTYTFIQRRLLHL